MWCNGREVLLLCSRLRVAAFVLDLWRPAYQPPLKMRINRCLVSINDDWQEQLIKLDILVAFENKTYFQRSFL